MPLHRLEEPTLGVEEENLQLTEYEKEQYLKVLHSSAIAAEPQTPNWQHKAQNNEGPPSATTVRSGEYWNEITASPYPSFSSTFSSEEEDWQHVIPSHHPAKNKEQLATWRQDSKLPEQNKEQRTTWRQDSKLPEQNREQLTTWRQDSKLPEQNREQQLATWRQDSKLPEQNKEQLTTWRQDSKLPEQNKEQLTTWWQDSKLPEQNKEQLSTWWQDSKLSEEDASIEEKRISSGFTSKGESWAAVTRPHPNSLPAAAEEPGPLPGNGHQSGGQTGGNSGQSWPLSPRGSPSTVGWPASGPSNQVPAAQPPPEPPLANQLRHLAASALPFTQVRNCSTL
jgi:hypothetical protein